MKKPLLRGTFSRSPLRAIHLRTIALIIIYYIPIYCQDFFKLCKKILFVAPHCLKNNGNVLARYWSGTSRTYSSFIGRAPGRAMTGETGHQRRKNLEWLNAGSPLPFRPQRAFIYARIDRARHLPKE